MTKYSLDKDKIKVLLLEGVHPNSVDNFKSAGYTNVEYVKGSLEEEALIEKNPRRTFHWYPLSYSPH